MVQRKLGSSNGTYRTAVCCFLAVLLAQCHVQGSANEETSKSGKGSATAVQAGNAATSVAAQVSTTPAADVTGNNGTHLTHSVWHLKLEELYKDGALTRTLCVLIGIATVLLLYFGIQFYRTRRWKNKARKYKITNSKNSAKESVPLGSWKEGEDEEENTLFTRCENRKA